MRKTPKNVTLTRIDKPKIDNQVAVTRFEIHTMTPMGPLTHHYEFDRTLLAPGDSLVITWNYRGIEANGGIISSVR
jgi:hypothetical protein